MNGVPERTDGPAREAQGEFTQDAARWIVKAHSMRIPDPVIRLAEHCLFDWFAVTIAGVGEELAPMITETALEGRAAPDGVALIGQPLRGTERQAALINGTISHALDFDDVNLRMHGHPTVVIAPALIAVAEREGASGVDLLRAFVTAYQVAGRLGHAMGDSHYGRGFHATGTIGAVAAAAGCAYLLKLDEDATEAALGLGATQASGLKAMFGTMAKPFHAGAAAESGVMAARLAQRGFTARKGGFERAQGFGAAMSDDADFPHGAFETTPPGAPEWEITRNLFKYHAACYLTHSTIEALGDLRAAHEIDPGEVSGVEVHVPASHRSVCDVRTPETGLDIKFSIRHLAALALNGADTARLSLYSDETARDLALSALRSVVRLTTDGEGAGARYGAKVVVTLKDGRALTGARDVSKPAEDLDAQEAALRLKATALIDGALGGALGGGAADRIFEAVSGLKGAADLSALLAAATPARAI